MQAVAVALAVVAWAAVVHRARQPGQSLLKPAFTSAGPTDAHNLRCIVITALVATLYVPSVAQWIDQLVDVPGAAATAMFALLVVGSGELLTALRCVALPPEQARQGRGRRGVGLTAVIIVMVAAVLAGHPGQADVTAPWGPGTAAQAWMALYWGAWLAWCGYAGARATVIATGYARGGPDRIVRQTLRILAVGGAALAAYATGKAVAIGLVVLGSEIPPPLMVATKAAVVVMGLAAAATSVWPAAARALRRRRIARQLAQVTPLWQRLRPVRPELVLDVSDRLDDDDAQVQLWRMCVEIADWWVLLAQRLPADAWSAAWRAASHLRGDQAVVAAAGWTEAGLRAHPGGPGESMGHSPSPPVPSGSAALQRFVLAVAGVSRDEVQKATAAVVMETV